MTTGQPSFETPPDALTYEPFFGLSEKPFSLDADPRFVYGSPTYEAARKSLLAGIRRREGLQVLTGEIGTGKTTLCRTVLRDLGRNTYSSLVPDPFAAREDLLKMMLIDFGVLSVEELTTGRLRQASRTELAYLLAEFLNSLAREAFAVTIIDEAQNLSLPLIEETRILFDTFGAKGRLQIVFVGQPELHAKLKLPEMRQVDQRICGYHRLAPMSAEAVAGYIQHRLQAAGARGDRALFPLAIVDALHRRSGGVPRLINRICDRALHLAHERKAERVDQQILDAALIDIGADTLSPNWDAIMFAQSPAAPPVPTPAPAPAAAAPAAAVSTPQRIKPALPADDDSIQQQIDEWVQQDLATPERATLPPMATDGGPVRRAAPKTASRPVAPARHVKTDWPRDVRSETYMSKLLRTWVKRAAIVAAILVGINVIVVGVSFLVALQTPGELPALPKAPAKAVSVMPNTPPIIETPLTQPPVAQAAPIVSATASAEYLVAVGLFASAERADELVTALTHADLPAMQRPFRLHQREMQQIVLGPFLSRADANADLRRLQALGGYDDARVISSNQ